MPLSLRSVRRSSFLLLPITLLALLALLVPAPGADAAAPGIRFGIYPGGGVGTVNIAAVRPTLDDHTLRLRALDRLRTGGRALVLHLYGDWDGRPARDVAEDMGADIANYTRAGFDVEPTIRYRPRVPGPGSPRAYAAAVRHLVTEFAKDPHVVSVQITNEANVPGAPDAADGAYPGAVHALTLGVVAADRAARAAGRRDIRIGFNWAAGSSRRAHDAFWRGIRRHSTAAFRRAIDWVGVDIYPGTWSTPAAAGNPALVRRAIRDTLRGLRSRDFRTARLPRRVALQISENGFPTGSGRTEAQQVAVMRASIRALQEMRKAYRITDYRWFDLRDAVSGTGQMENEYGIVRDDYSEKQGFGVLRALIAKYGVAA